MTDCKFVYIIKGNARRSYIMKHWRVLMAEGDGGDYDNDFEDCDGESDE